MVERRVTIVEVGPRDGLQNEPGFVPTALKLDLINRLAHAGLRRIEATAFVSPKWVPQMADHAEVMAGVTRQSAIAYSALVPNEKGAAAAITAGADALAVFTAASETFSRRNTNCSISEGITRFRPVMALAEKAGLPVRGYISCALDCPYEGTIAPEAVADVAARLFDLGCAEIAVSDTIGTGTPERTTRAFEATARHVPMAALAGHFHDTKNGALANVEAALALGVRVFDGAVGGLGGCPYAEGAPGNLATEKLVAWLEKAGWETNLNGAEIAKTAMWIRHRLKV
ncbi:MAG: hydroxymethylglutaryl-CoA lyase [Proteobacteria bacterium]|nr:hydroxymethylglutaryl-CoA lyase [Pseudomonadota bacterium]